MIRSLVRGSALCTLLGLTLLPSAHAQEAEKHVAQAQQTLTELARLFDDVRTRQTALSQGRTPANTAAGESSGSISLFDGATLSGWKRTEFSDGGKSHVETSFRGGPPAIVVEAGSPLSGLTWTGAPPRTNYEITLEAMKIDGMDFLCGLTFPVGDSYASLIVGGWGGGVVGISSIDGLDASENATSHVRSFPKDRWFAIRMRVTPDKLETWIDDQKIIDQVITGRKISLRFGEISKSVPLGLATYQTTAAFRAIKLRRLDATSSRLSEPGSKGN